MIRATRKEWLTVDEVAEKVGKSSFTVYGWIRSGDLPARNCGKQGAKKPRYRVHQTDVVNLLTRLATGLPLGT